MHRRQRLLGLREVSRMLVDIRTPVDTHDRDVLQQNSIRLNRRDASAGESNDQQSSLRRDAFRREIEYVSSHWIADDVGATASGDLFHTIHPRRVSIADRMLGAETPAEVQLLRASRGGDDPGAERFADL